MDPDDAPNDHQWNADRVGADLEVPLLHREVGKKVINDQTHTHDRDPVETHGQEVQLAADRHSQNRQGNRPVFEDKNDEKDKNQRSNDQGGNRIPFQRGSQGQGADDCSGNPDGSAYELSVKHGRGRGWL